MNQIEHVFRLRRDSIEPSFHDQTRELRSLIDYLEETARNFPERVFYGNRKWFYTEDEQTRAGWLPVREMLEALDIPIQCREPGLFGFHPVELPEKLILQNFDFLREILPAPEETEFKIQRINSSVFQSPRQKITHFKFSHSILEVVTNIALVLSDDEVVDLMSDSIFGGMTIWEVICIHLFARPIKYIVVHSVSKCLGPEGKIETRYSAQLNLVWERIPK